MTTRKEACQRDGSLKLVHSCATTAPWLCNPQGGIRGCTGTEVWPGHRKAALPMHFKPFNTDHALNCPTGGLLTARHNEVRDLLASLQTEVSSDIAVEPVLQTITGEIFQWRSTSTNNGARLNIRVRGFWGSWSESTFLDVRIFNPNTPSNHTPLRGLMYHHSSRPVDALPVDVWGFGQSVQCIPWRICYKLWSTQPPSVGSVVLGLWGIPACGRRCSVAKRPPWCPAVWGSCSLPQRDHWCMAGLQLF